MTDRQSKASMRPSAPVEVVENAADEPPPVKPKKKKLTKAEKKELKRLREMAFKKLEMQTTFKRELELSRKTAKKLKFDWGDTLIEMKLIELREELTEWEYKAQRQLQEKDLKIQNMLTFINSLEESNLLMASRLKVFFEYIVDIFKGLTNSGKLLYETTASDMIVDFHEGLDERRVFQSARRLHCENVMHTTNLVFEKELVNDYNIFVERRNDNVNVAIEKRYRIRDEIVKKMKSTRQQLLEFVQQLGSTSLDPYKYDRIRVLMQKQRTFYVESQRLNAVEKKQRRTLNELHCGLLQSEMKFMKGINDLKLEQSYFLEIRKGIEAKIDADKLSSFEKLKILSSESYVVTKFTVKKQLSLSPLQCIQSFVQVVFRQLTKYTRPYADLQHQQPSPFISSLQNGHVYRDGVVCITAYNVCCKHLEKLRDYGELLLSVAANVRKFQTEAEKVVLWGDFTPSDNKMDIEELRKFVLTVIDPNSHVDRSDEEFYDELNLMRVFWRRMAIVQTQIAMLTKEKQQLTAENKKYTDFVRSLGRAAEPDKLANAITINALPCSTSNTNQCPKCE